MFSELGSSAYTSRQLLVTKCGLFQRAALSCAFHRLLVRYSIICGVIAGGMLHKMVASAILRYLLFSTLPRTVCSNNGQALLGTIIESILPNNKVAGSAIGSYAHVISQNKGLHRGEDVIVTYGSNGVYNISLVMDGQKVPAPRLGPASSGSYL